MRFLFIGFIVICAGALTAQTEEWEFYSYPTPKSPMVDTPNYIYYGSNPGLGRINRQTQQVEMFYSFNSGLQEPYIRSLYYDSSGLLWIGGERYLVSFDGNDGWQTYDLSSAPTEPGWINAIHRDSAGWLWLGCTQGLFKTDFITWTHFDETNTPLANMNVWRIEIDYLDRVWIGNSPNSGDLAYYDGNSWTLMGSNFDEMYFILEDLQHNIWVGSFNLRKFNGTGWTTIPSPGVSNWNWNYFTCADVDNQNRLYVGNMFGEIFIVNNGVVSQYLDDYPNGIGTIKSVIVDAANVPYYSSDLIFRDHTQIQNTYQIVNKQNLSAICRDSQHNLWAAHVFGGVSMFDGTAWQSYDSDTFLNLNNYIEDLAIGEADTLWSLQLSGIVIHCNGNWSYFQPPNLAVARAYSQIEIDSHNTVWIGSDYGLVYRDATGWHLFDATNSPLPDNTITDLTLDAQYRLWIATEAGIALYDRGAWQVFDASNAPFEGMNFKSLFCDRQNRIWARTSTHLYMYDNSLWYGYHLPIESDGFGYSDLAQDGLGRIWVLLNYDGIGIFDGTDWEVWDDTNSLIQGYATYSVFSEPDGRIWIGLHGGVQTYYVEPVAGDDALLVPPAELEMRCYPNPSAASVSICMPARGSDTVSAQVFNIRGQVVRDLGSKTSLAGEETVFNWDGLDSQGSQVASGIYLVRAKCSEGVVDKRIVRIN